MYSNAQDATSKYISGKTRCSARSVASPNGVT